MKYEFEITTSLTQDTKLSTRGAQLFYAYGETALDALQSGLSLINVEFKQGIGVFHAYAKNLVDIHSNEHGKEREAAEKWRVEYHERRGSVGKEHTESIFLDVQLRKATDEKPLRAPRGASERLKVPLTESQANKARLAANAAGMELGAWLREKIVSELK